MRISRYLGTVGVLAMLLCCSVALGQTTPAAAVPFISQVTPSSLAPSSSPSLGVQFTLTILGANFPRNPVVKLSVPQATPLWAASATVNANGTQIVAQFNTSMPRPAVYAVTVATSVNNPMQVSNIFYLPVTPPATTVGISQQSSGFLTGIPSAMATGDFDGDGNVDVAVVSQGTNTVSILLGAFGGFLNPGASYPTGYTPFGIVAADFNGDGVLDLAFTNSRDNTIIVFLGNGDGTFRLGSTINDPGTYPTKIIAADFNGDGLMDLAVVNACGPVPAACYPVAGPPGPGSVLVLLGNGDGTFSVSPAFPSTGSLPWAIAAADLNSDGAIDLVVANQNDNNVTLLMGNGDGTFTPTQSPVPTGNGPSAIAIGDFNGDGQLDLAVTNSGDNTVSILLNQSCARPPQACTFSAAPISPAVGVSPWAISAGDMNADGFVDLVVANEGSSSISVLLGNGVGGFSAVFPQQQYGFSTGAAPQAMALADFSGDGRLDVATVNASGGYSILTQTPVPQVVLTTTDNSPTYGMVEGFMVSVNPSIGIEPTGTVTLFDGTNSLGTFALNGYQANFIISTLQTGAHQITATYNGDSNYLASTSPAVMETVSRAQTTFTVGSNVNTVPFGQPFTLSATVQPQFSGTPTGTVNFFDITDSTSLGNPTLSNGVAQLTLSTLSPGAHMITAWYDGDANFLGSSTLQAYTENITQASTTVSVATSASPVSLGQTPTFTATVQPSAATAATGYVLFFADGSTFLGQAQVTNNSAQLQAPVLSVGARAITAQYTGDINYTRSTSSPILEMVNPATDNVILSTSPAVYGQAATFVASVQGVNYSGTATGTMAFSDGSTGLGIVPLSNGSAQFTATGLAAGTHSISASYSGDANFQPATSAQVATNVLKANTTTVVSSGQNPSAFGQAVLLTATVQAAFGGAAAGTVTFLDGATSLGTSSVSSNLAQLSLSSLSAGSHSITAKYNGDTNFSPSTSVAVTQTVNQASTTTTVGSSPNPSAFGQTVTLTASVQSSSNGTLTGNVTFFDGSSSLGSSSLSGNSAQLTLASLSPGSHSITAKYSGASNYAASSSAALTQSVSQSGSSTALISSSNPSFFGQAVTFTVNIQPSYSGMPTGTVNFFDGSNSLGSISLSGGSAQLALSNLSLGSHSITAKYSGDSNFTASTSTSLAQSVTQAATATNVSSNANPSTYSQVVTFSATVAPAYNGTPTGTVSFFDGNSSLGNANLSNGVATLSTSAITLIPGSHSITAKYSGDSNFLASSSPSFSQIVNPAATVTTLASSANPSAVGKSVTFTAHVSSSVSGTLTGTVNFYLDGGINPLTSVALSAGSAHFSTNSLSAGTHSLTSAFVSSNSNFSGSTSAPLTQAITDFSISASPASNTIARGTSGTYTLTLTPLGGLTGNVSLSCGGVPGGTTCAISPSPVILDGTNPAQATVTLTAAKNAATGTHTLTLKGTSGSFTHSTSVTLTIN